MCSTQTTTLCTLCLMMVIATHTHTTHTHRNIVLKAPYSVQEQPREVLHTYLDTVGRPVVVATKSNLVEQHIVDFEVSVGCW